MRHRLTPSQYLLLLAVMLTASVGDTLLSHGMRQVGPVSLAHLGLLLHALLNPWVFAGILCLLGFFGSYLYALSWADLTFVLPATAFGYVVVALLSHLWLGETISTSRWIGILLIVGGVGFVANGPALTEHPVPPDCLPSAEADRCRPSSTNGGRPSNPHPLRSHPAAEPFPSPPVASAAEHFPNSSDSSAAHLHTPALASPSTSTDPSSADSPLPDSALNEVNLPEVVLRDATALREPDTARELR